MKKLSTIVVAMLLLLQMISLSWAWEIERPSMDIDIKERTESACTNGEASVGLGICIDDYDENAGEYGGDYVALNVSMTANSRMGIQYIREWQSLWWIPENELYYRNDYVGLGDDVGVWVNIPQEAVPFFFRFYGGPGSAEYKKVWVCTNGFVCFDDNFKSTTPNLPPYIPYPSKPNALIAGLWTDLKIDNYASIITGLWALYGHYYFVITWKNAFHKASGKRLTFQIILEDAPEYYPIARRYGQSRIWISYKSVSSINTDTAFGIEDQQGYKGDGVIINGAYLGDLNEKTLYFSTYTHSYFLKKLTLTFQDTNPQTEFDIKEDWRLQRGYNIRWNEAQPAQPDETYMFAKAVAGTATLLISAISLVAQPPVWVPAAGFIIDTALCSLDWAEMVAYCQYSGRQVEVQDRDDYLEGEASAAALTYDYTVDASLSLIVYWILKTPNAAGGHSLTITAKLEYYEYLPTGELIDKGPITTSINLKIGPDDNNSFPTADEIQPGTSYRFFLGGYDDKDYYKIYVEYGYIINIYATAASSPSVDFYIDLYNPSQQWKTGTSHGYSHNIYFTADSTGYWFIKASVYYWLSCGFYKLLVSIYDPAGGGCPYLYAWNGSHFLIDNNILPASETSNGIDVIDYYRLEQTLEPCFTSERFSLYSLMIEEFENEHSYIDHIKLLAIDHSSDVKVGVTQNGQILAYMDPVPPISAINSLQQNVLTLLFSVDNDYYEGYKDDYLTLNFGNVTSENVKLVLRTDFPVKKSIHVQIQNAKGNWTTIATIIPRTYWATDVIDISNYLPNFNSQLKIRLCFTASHKIDFIGLDTSPRTPLQIRNGTLIFAKHSTNGLVISLLRYNDNQYAELLPQQNIKIWFIVPNQTAESRTYIVITKGRYHSITS